MKNRKLWVLALFTLLVFSGGLLAQQYSYDYKTMTMDEYKAELAKWQKREADAKAAIAEEEAKIAQLKEELASLDKEIDAVYNEIYALLGTDEAGYKEYLNQVQGLENDVQAFLGLSPEEIYERRNELDNFKSQLATLRQDKRSNGVEAFEALQRIEGLISQAEEKATPAAAGRYEVQPGDYLWKIAKRPDIYGDPYAWMRIYTANRDQIKNPDLIYPRQVFRIPKVAGPNEYWVERGDYLSKIAGMANVFGDPFKWQRLYEANRDVIADPNMIYPYMILVIPRD
ncbi:MAG: LysM peptidoglycan-binding domain-containing protein [Calditrichaeota bacterium]|nr:MAG: LysM peptidoglycan-binding domain-containing protein [Calditrichota bacterium]